MVSVTAENSYQLVRGSNVRVVQVRIRQYQKYSRVQESSGTKGRDWVKNHGDTHVVVANKADAMIDPQES